MPKPSEGSAIKNTQQFIQVARIEKYYILLCALVAWFWIDYIVIYIYISLSLEDATSDCLAIA